MNAKASSVIFVPNEVQYVILEANINSQMYVRFKVIRYISAADITAHVLFDRGIQ